MVGSKPLPDVFQDYPADTIAKKHSFISALKYSLTPPVPPDVFFGNPNLTKAKPFSTPGSTHTYGSPLKFYFDNPAEDPCSSDPLDEADYALALDYDMGGEQMWNSGDSGIDIPDLYDDKSSKLLDDTSVFAFAPTLAPSTDAAANTKTVIQEYTAPATAPLNEDPDQPQMGHNSDDMYAWILSDGSGSLQDDIAQDEEAYDSGEKKVDEPTRTPPAPCFAPAPGIYLSPLRNAIVEDDKSDVTKKVANDQVRPADKNNSPVRQVLCHLLTLDAKSCMILIFVSELTTVRLPLHLPQRERSRRALPRST